MVGSTSKAVTLLDVTAFSLGIETANDGFATIIRSNSQIPTVETRPVTTAVDNQRTIRVHVLQGDSPRASQNLSLGEFELTNIQPASAGVPQIEIKFSVNSSGMVEVSAFDKKSGERNEIMIQNNDGLSTAYLEDIKSRIDRGEEPEVITENTSLEQPTDIAPQETPGFKHPAEERLYQLQKIITDNRQKLGSNSISSLEKFISQAQTLLGNEKHSSKWSILEKRIEGVVQDLQKQVQS